MNYFFTIILHLKITMQKKSLKTVNVLSNSQVGFSPHTLVLLSAYIAPSRAVIPNRGGAAQKDAVKRC